MDNNEEQSAKEAEPKIIIPNPEFNDLCNSLRKSISELESAVLSTHMHKVFNEKEKVPGQHQEMHANLHLAYRHLEDARTRISKAVLAHAGGVSIYYL
jgi:hypothetical protein